MQEGLFLLRCGESPVCAGRRSGAVADGGGGGGGDNGRRCCSATLRASCSKPVDSAAPGGDEN